MIIFFEDILNQRPIKVIPSNGVTLIALRLTLITPRVNKANIIIVNKNKLSFLLHVFWNEKHVGECMNKKTKYFYICL